ncbi:MAG TPA: lamin tail domain-containing protein [Dehalococcoidia bacterium]|nr:lamin tail domain-containing protein [Dehalococcoidia bacterium]
MVLDHSSHYRFDPAPTPTSASIATRAPTASPTAVAADVVVQCVFFDGLVKTTEADEYVEVLDQGTGAVDLEGWQLIDQSEGTPQLVFPAYSLQPKSSVRVYTNEVHPESGGFSFQRRTSIWNNSSPDTAALINPSGETVSTNDYPPGC